MKFSYKKHALLIFVLLLYSIRTYCYGGLYNPSPVYKQYELARQADYLMNPDADLASIRELRVAQQYGDPTYDKFDPYSFARFYGFTGLVSSTRTRQAIVSFQVAALLFPSPFLPDVNGNDINDHAFTFMQAFGARLGVFFNPFNSATWGNIFGILELDFSGTASFETIYCAKIRHSFGELVWKTGSFLYGQYYHPLFLRNCFPRTISYNAGAPFEPQALVPQARLEQFWGDIEFIFALAGEAYIESFGPGIGGANSALPSNSFFENAIVPNCHFQVKWWNEESFIGAALDYKRLTPRLVSSINYKVNEHIDSIISEAFAHYVFPLGEFNVKVVYSQNGSDQLLISGFAVKTDNPVTDFRTYANTAAISGWLDTFLLLCNREVELGVFFGAVQNLGASTALFINPTTNQPIVYALDGIAQAIDYLYRVGPRIAYANKSFRFGFELVWEKIAYGTLDDHARVINAIPVQSFSYEVSLDYVF